jgi:glycosyltransferase involved in cell wall biosynthesis
VLLVSKGLDIGGIERIVVDLARGLSRRGARVEVAVVNDRRDRLASPLADAGIVLHRLGGTDHIGWSAARRLARLVAEPRFDVVHVHGPLPAVLARLAPRHRPVITTSHTVWGALRRPTRVAWRVTAGRDATTLAVSAVVAASLPRRVARRTLVLPHGVDPAAIAAAERVGGDTSEVVTAVTVASHRDPKNYPNLLRGIRAAVDAGAPVRLVAVGEGPDLPRHQKLVRELGLDAVVEFRPPSPDVLSVIASGDLLVVASDVEGQPMVVAEALALGRPVVATAVGRVPELVSPSVGRVVPPGDPQALGAALAELAGDAKLRHRLGQAAAAHGLAWTLDDVVDAHLAIYREVASR